ncbi:hypothetical protein QBC42DRAFT_66316 [Cladorrhinum samala]|uniref:CCZ1/INTU/HSP4 first Longin domain-containing protein n=1 Tax=Cladorrhinum samala TaxID=585594 RepID=A0AAV9HVE6_9PEZI|nr:hypothetical protein QBC42DRAFT_66316 [Cladorrhinum samala]
MATTNANTSIQGGGGPGIGTGLGIGTATGTGTGIIPAQLGFMAIYNPSLGSTDETLDDQIAYYASVHAQLGGKRRRRRRQEEADADAAAGSLSAGEERNERLRQIGLAQGMVEFGKGFSNGRAVESIETEGRRIVLHELEPGWWVLASIDLTRIQQQQQQQEEGKVEFSSREVKPVALLLQDLLRAHSVFLLHHASSLSALFVRVQRAKFVALLGRYWDSFLSTWNVLLHGNPACSVFGGIKIAECGELGIGVGEEERGSGEREVLEGLVGRMDGLVDLVVGRYGSESGEGEQWLGTGSETGAEDGAVFLGVGALSRSSLRAISYWMEDMYAWGDNAYGVSDSPTATRSQLRRRRAAKRQSRSKSLDVKGASKVAAEPSEAGKGKMDNLFGYLTLGYGTSWSLSGSPTADKTHLAPGQTADSSNSPHPNPPHTANETSPGRFLIGLMGNIDDAETDDAENPDSQDAANSRTLLRTLTVELEQEGEDRPESETAKDMGSQNTELASQAGGKDAEEDGHIPDTASMTFDSQDRNKTKKVRVVVYVNRPFIYVFLFKLGTQSLALEGLYRSLHVELAPLHKPLLSSTSYRPGRPDVDGASKVSAAQIYDLVWDPAALTIHSTIPNIPGPVTLQSHQRRGGSWSRVEALNTHNQILNVFASTRDDGLAEFERTCKTSRGWWVVWTRILEGVGGGGGGGGGGPGSSAAASTGSNLPSETGDADGGGEGKEVKVVKEILLIRKVY